jgi:hypothetical protein
MNTCDIIAPPALATTQGNKIAGEADFTDRYAEGVIALCASMISAGDQAPAKAQISGRSKPMSAASGAQKTDQLKLKRCLRSSSAL